MNRSETVLLTKEHLKIRDWATYQNHLARVKSSIQHLEAQHFIDTCEVRR